MIDLSICVGSACHIHGSTKMISLFQEAIETLDIGNYIRLKGAFCQNNCQKAVCVKVAHRQYDNLTQDDVYPLLKALQKEFKWNT
ncbi:MAG: (2Fe-2S) ferredoxin domain-containing protein [Candidatus Izemoplasma sp.]|nr:(2Fe-2S) ferredoxin domain-containing protein [Candidatus Izemoplasma sp.]